MTSSNIEIIAPLGSSPRADAAVKIMSAVDGLESVTIGPAVPERGYHRETQAKFSRTPSGLSLLLPHDGGFRCFLVSLYNGYDPDVIGRALLGNLRLASLPPETSQDDDEDLRRMLGRKPRRRAEETPEAPVEEEPVPRPTDDPPVVPSPVPESRPLDVVEPQPIPARRQMSDEEIDVAIYAFAMERQPGNASEFDIEGLVPRLIGEGFTLDSINRSLQALEVSGHVRFLGPTGFTPPYQRHRIVVTAPPHDKTSE